MSSQVSLGRGADWSLCIGWLAFRLGLAGCGPQHPCCCPPSFPESLHVITSLGTVNVSRIAEQL